MNASKARDITQIALMAALMSVVAPFSIPLPITLVPLSFANLIIFIFANVLGARKAVLGVAIYLALGLAGLPVFSGGTGGLQKLVGPTGGYLIGYLFCALSTGLFMEFFHNKIAFNAVGMVIGMVICDVLGTAWLSYSAHISFSAALSAGVIPFLPGDLVKIAAALGIGYALRKRLKAIGLIQ